MLQLYSIHSLDGTTISLPPPPTPLLPLQRRPLEISLGKPVIPLEWRQIYCWRGRSTTETDPFSTSPPPLSSAFTHLPTPVSRRVVINPRHHGETVARHLGTVSTTTSDLLLVPMSGHDYQEHILINPIRASGDTFYL